MHIINVDRISINHAGRVIFRELSWAIGDRDKVGLVGANGAGKSSLFKAIAGVITPDAGSITKMRGVRLGYLPQEVTLTQGRTVLQEASILPPELERIERELTNVEDELGKPEVYGDSEVLARTLTKQERLLDEFEKRGGTQHGNRVRSVLAQLGFAGDDLNLLSDGLSGGQKKLLALARLAVEAPDVLLLDEPDNHLDLNAKAALEEFINDYEGAVILISHDRYLLDGVATTIAELADGKLTLYKGNYTAYTTELELRRLRQQQMYVAQQKEIQRIQEAIKRFEQWASIVVNERHIKQARSRRKMLERMEANGEIIEKVKERRTMDLRLEGWRGSTKVIEITDLAMAFGDNLIFTDLNLLIQHGERVGLIGGNGAGKSVLFRLILGEHEPLDGIIKVGPSVRIGYYAQEHQTLSKWLERTPIDLIRDLTPIGEGEAVALLGRYLFSYEQTRQPIHTLSGGERSRLQLASLILKQPNLLLLDEPTNNLDLPSVEVLERTLDDFEGSIFVISHDRYFLDQVVDRVIELENGAARGFEGGYTDYLEAKKNPKRAAKLVSNGATTNRRPRGSLAR
jgi:ATP-binding cassette, subfamily F, member 3